MPRKAREKCPDSVYHIIVRGNNKQDIFLDEYDRMEYLKRLKRYKEAYQLEVYSYCLMTNHVHLLIHDKGQDISDVMKGFNLSYVIYFNKKYNCCGHLFQDRFKSFMVKNDVYFSEVSRYIHRNPVEANIVRNAEDHKWSSASIYLGAEDPWKIVDSRRILGYFSDEYEKSKKLYSEYLREKNIEEIAATIESGSVRIREEREYRVINEEKMIQMLGKVAEYLNIHHLYLLKKNNKRYGKQRDICIYVMALAGKTSHRQLGDLFYVKPSAIGVSIRRAIDQMIQNEELSNGIKDLVKKIA
ncbi:MAG: transposase [Clostridia bacterium]|jgi:REP element-mobilizing transposase RayT|nr:transposase [Clostridia bacterium]